MLIFGRKFALNFMRFHCGTSLFGCKFAGFSNTAFLKSDEKLRALTLNDDERQFPAHVVRIVDEIASLTLLEVADLNELLSKRLNIKAPTHAVTAMPLQRTSSEAQEDSEEIEQTPSRTSYAVKLMKFDSAKKVALIKEIKNILPDMNLVQAKKFVEAAPGILKKDLSKDEAEQMKKALEACGAAVEIE